MAKVGLFMKNFKIVLSKTVASVYTAHTYGFAIRGHALPRRDSGRHKGA